MSLSVRSIASLSCVSAQRESLCSICFFCQTHSCRTHVLDGGDFVAYNLHILISIQLASAVSILSDAPRRSSSRSVRQLMKERELLIRSVVNLMVAEVWAYF